MAAWARDRVSLAFALAVHAVALGWASVPSRAPAPSAPPALVLETEVDVDPLPAEVVPAPPSPSEPVPPTAPSHAAARPASAEHGGAASNAPAAAGVESVETAAPGASSSWTFSPIRPEAQAAGDGRALANATAGAVTAVLAEADRKAADRARKPKIFTARDMQLGLVPGNQYVAITRDRVRTSLVPMNGHALLEFWTDSKGVVARIRVVSPSSDPRAWQDMAKALEEDARSTPPLTIPSNADGFIITLDVTSVLRTVTGETPSPGAIAAALRAMTNPVDALIDAKASPRRVVTARVTGVEAF